MSAWDGERVKHTEFSISLEFHLSCNWLPGREIDGKVIKGRVSRQGGSQKAVPRSCGKRVIHQPQRPGGSFAGMVRAVDKVELDGRMECVDPTPHPMGCLVLS